MDRILIKFVAPEGVEIRETNKQYRAFIKKKEDAISLAMLCNACAGDNSTVSYAVEKTSNTNANGWMVVSMVNGVVMNYVVPMAYQYALLKHMKKMNEDGDA